MTRRLYVVHPRGWRLPHHGGFRGFGDFFEDLPEDVHNALADSQPDVFSKTAPKAEASKPASMPALASKQEDDDE